VSVGVIDAGIAVGWLSGQHRSFPKIVRLFEASRAGRSSLVLSVVNLAEVLKVTEARARATGTSQLAMLHAARVELHQPDEAVAARAAHLAQCSLADAFAAATALELGARLHTTDRELVQQLAHVRVQVTHY
jgi:predicted nucleic acid-binding protein